MQSETVTDLLPALAAAVSEMRNPKKNAANPHFKNRFADLSEVLDCIREPLHNAGLVMTQTIDLAKDVDVSVLLVTRVWHCKTGQWIESRVPLLLDKPTAQAQGSAITYAKRYAIKAFFGMADDDDDGQLASTPRQAAKPAAKPEPKQVNAFPTVEHALSAVEDISSKPALAEWAARVAGSRFQGDDKTAAREAYSNKLAELESTAETP